VIIKLVERSGKAYFQALEYPALRVNVPKIGLDECFCTETPKEHGMFCCVLFEATGEQEDGAAVYREQAR